MKKILKGITAFLLALAIVVSIGDIGVSAAKAVQVTKVSFTVKDGDFVYGQSKATISFKINKASKVVVKIYDSSDDEVYTKTYKSCKAKKVYSFKWDGKKASTDDYYVVVTAGKSSLKSEVLSFYKSTGFKKGNGSKSNPYTVSTTKEFLNVARFNGRYFKQTEDLDYSSEDFIPLFTVEEPFTGVYDGNGKTVKNITNNGTSDNTGFFRCIATKAVVENLSFEDCVFAGNNFVGVLAGQNNGEINDCKIMNCTINASGEETGALIGQNNGKITSCIATGNIIKNVRRGGALVGRNEANGYIKSCETTENTVTGSSTSHGGVVGRNFGTVTLCIATDNTVSGGDSWGEYWIGGIVGANHGIVSKCEVSNLKGLISGGKRTGGIVGENSDGGLDTNCVYYGEPVS